MSSTSNVSAEVAPAQPAVTQGATTAKESTTTGSKKGVIKIFGLATAAAGAKQTSSKSPFVEVPISSVQVSYDDESKYLEQTTLTGLREELKAVLRGGKPYKFCTDECSVVAEDVSLTAYRGMLKKQPDTSEGLMRVYIVASNEPGPTQVAALLTPPFQLKFIQMGETAKDALNTGTLHSDAFKGKDPTTMLLSELRKLIPKMSKTAEVHTFCSLDGSAAADELALSTYLDLDGDGVQEKGATPSILIRYRKTDAKVSAAASKFHGASPEVLAAMERLKPNLEFKDRSAEELKMDTSELALKEELDASQFAARDANPRKYTSLMDEADWDAVLRNCCLLYGWKVNRRTNEIERATTPAFRLREKAPVLAALPPLPAPAPAPPATEASSAPAQSPAPNSTSTDVAVQGDTATTAPSQDTPSSEKNTQLEPLKAEDIHTTPPMKLGAIPSYAINDQSRIEVVNVTSSIQESMAKNHFSASSIEASASGGWGGFSVGVTGGVASESSVGVTSANKEVSKKMIASYKFPRVTVFLRPEDLEPTEELARALKRVEESKNINDLRKIHSTFGQLFCHSVTLGGCLQTSKMVTGSEFSLQTEEKEKFKAEVGAAISTPFGASAEVKGSHETQDSKSTATKRSASSEAMTFEATGGNTILAADPPAWSGSVADFNNWRIINQSEPTHIVDAIAQMPGFEKVQAWFFRAVPALSQYLMIPDSRSLHVRFRADSPSGALQRITDKRSQAYLGVDAENPPTPLRSRMDWTAPQTTIHQEMAITPHGAVLDMTLTSKQIDEHTVQALFYPYTTQAPVLVFPKGNDTAAISDKQILETVWKLEVAEGSSIGPNSLICIKSCAKVQSALNTSAPDLMLSVYRNAQGVFQPSIMSTDEPCYWRFQRVSNSASSASSNESFRHGEEVRLTWSFADQSAGFRDYYGDFYGRRNYSWPEGVGGSVLTFKVPYPRFEGPGQDTVSLVMNSALVAEPLIQTMEIRQLETEKERQVRGYNLHDLTFRLDTVGNEGYGDAYDIMNVISSPTKQFKVETTYKITGQKTFQDAFSDGSLVGMLAAQRDGRARLVNGRDGASIIYSLS